MDAPQRPNKRALHLNSHHIWVAFLRAPEVSPGDKQIRQSLLFENHVHLCWKVAASWATLADARCFRDEDSFAELSFFRNIGRQVVSSTFYGLPTDAFART